MLMPPTHLSAGYYFFCVCVCVREKRRENLCIRVCVLLPYLGLSLCYVPQCMVLIQDIATFEGVIIGTDERDSVNLREDLVAWAANKPSVSIQGQQVQVVNPGNNDDNEKDSDATSAAIGISIAVIIVVLLAFAVVIAVVIILYSKHKSKR